ncbi:MAG: hypothetical protein U0R44_02575 [Candidatus Micrarchaeia archaeon]
MDFFQANTGKSWLWKPKRRGRKSGRKRLTCCFSTKELQKEAEKRINELRWEADLLYDFYGKITQVIDTKSLEQRFKGKSACSIIESLTQSG